MSPAAVAVRGPATKTLVSVPKGRIVASTWPVVRSTCIAPPDPAGIQSEFPEITAWNCGSQPPSCAVVGALPRFGGGFQSDCTVQLATSWLPCQTKCCSFQVCESQASGPHGKGVCLTWSAQETYVPAVFTAA